MVVEVIQLKWCKVVYVNRRELPSNVDCYPSLTCTVHERGVRMRRAGGLQELELGVCRSGRDELISCATCPGKI